MPFPLIHNWRLSLSPLLVIAAVALALGFWFHAIPEALLIVVVIYLIATLAQLHQLNRWLIDRQRNKPLETWGIWSDIYSLFNKRQRAAFKSKRRLVRVLRAFRDAATALPDAVVVLDAGHRILWFNRSTQRLLGLKYPQDLGGYITNLVRAPHVAKWLEASGNESLLDVVSPHDENIRLSLTLIPYTDNQTLLVARDVSQLLRLEQVRRDFVANVSHELRTPLTVVHGYLDLLEPEQLPEFESILRELRTQSRRMKQIVEDLLTLSRLEAQDSLPEERITMRAVLEALRREAQGLSQNRHTLVIEQVSHQDLRGSAKELHSAFSNLVSNAVRYTPENGRITIRWENNLTEGRLIVQDSGQGIPAQHIPRLTERFYRVSTSRSRETGGTGLGLSIVKHVLQLHQARLEIRSEIGAGSTFTCIFGSERLLST